MTPSRCPCLLWAFRRIKSIAGSREDTRARDSSRLVRRGWSQLFDQAEIERTKRVCPCRHLARMALTPTAEAQCGPSTFVQMKVTHRNFRTCRTGDGCGFRSVHTRLASQQRSNQASNSWLARLLHPIGGFPHISTQRASKKIELRQNGVRRRLSLIFWRFWTLLQIGVYWHLWGCGIGTVNVSRCLLKNIQESS